VGEAPLKVSVVVPAFNEERLLAGSLAAIRAAMVVFEESELIVCDNNSTDRTAEIARSAGATVVFEPVNQIARARNAGAARASGDWLVFVDADSYPDKVLFEEVVQAVRSGRFIGGGATVTFETGDAAVRAALAAWNAISRMAKWAAGSFIFCEAAAFRALGGFSEALYAAEEIDFSRRLKRLARSRGLGVVILHRHPLRTSDRKARLYTKREYLAFMLKTLLLGGRTLRGREACHLWYDGRR
jgi:glycosyltransferase involved in cell wall biosynthesis